MYHEDRESDSGYRQIQQSIRNNSTSPHRLYTKSKNNRVERLSSREISLDADEASNKMKTRIN